MVKDFMFLGFILVSYFVGMNNLIDSVEITRHQEENLDKSITDVDYEVKQKNVYSKNDILYIIYSNEDTEVIFNGKIYRKGSEIDFLIDTESINENIRYSYSIREKSNGEKVMSFA